MQRMSGSARDAAKAKLPALATLDFSEHPLLAKEMDRVASGRKLNALDMKRYELPEPSTAQKNDMDEWQKCVGDGKSQERTHDLFHISFLSFVSQVDNAKAQLEHQSLRLIDLELLSKYGQAAWLSHIVSLTQMKENANQALNRVQAAIEEVNARRQTAHADAGAQLLALETRWGALVSANCHLALTCDALQSQVAQQPLDASASSSAAPDNS